MIIVKSILLLLHFTLIPVAVGRLITYRADATHQNPFVVYLTGLFGSWGIFFVLFAFIEGYQNWTTYTVPVIGCFSLLVKIYSVVIAILTIAAIALDMKKYKSWANLTKLRNYNHPRALAENKMTVLYGLIFAAVLIVQLYFAYGYQINEWSYDDYEYVVASLDNISTDTINYVNPVYGYMPYTLEKRSVSSWTTYVSYLAKVSGFEVTTICHTIMPVLFLIIAYIIYYYLSKLLFKEVQSRIIFLIVLSNLYSLGLYSHYSVTFRLLCAVWQGKGVLYALIIPFIFTYLVQLYRNEFSVSNLLPVIAVSVGACSLTFMATFIVATIHVLMWLVVSIRERKPVHVGYMLAGLVGPAFQLIFYSFIHSLLLDARGITPWEFRRGSN